MKNILPEEKIRCLQATHSRILYIHSLKIKLTYIPSHIYYISGQFFEKLSEKPKYSLKKFGYADDLAYAKAKYKFLSKFQISSRENGN
ncbi:unnamed protein product [Paramecium pentaurelia]|uniref:Uncharacterized protein n=1 Tax=Paramecium pentaurelia TaxID=43138 RepID=A0A8S1WLI1_9CILI|nr:unnamed protein product [Paramecium pentaurelia]